MNNKTLLLLAGAGALAAYFLKGKKEAYENLDIKPLDIAIDTARSKQAKWMKLYYKIKIRLTNPSNFAINVKSINLDFIVNDKRIGNLENETTINVPGNSNKTITLVSFIQSATIIETILLILADSSNIKLAIDGEVVTDLGTVTIDFQKNVSL